MKMKVKLNTNLRKVINDCASHIHQLCLENDIDETTHCELCPLAGACLEVLTGDDSENK